MSSAADRFEAALRKALKGGNLTTLTLKQPAYGHTDQHEAHARWEKGGWTSIVDPDPVVALTRALETPPNNAAANPIGEKTRQAAVRIRRERDAEDVI